VRSAIVTGAASGIGRAIARTLAARGYAVVIADIDQDPADELAAALTATGAEVRAVRTDVAEERDVAALVGATLDAFGRLDVMVNNAALMGVGPFGADADLLSMTAERWDLAFAVTLRGQMLGCKHALPPMLAAGAGVIVNMSSASSLRGDFTRIAYGSAKAGINALTRHVATRYGKQGIRCNAIAPGLVQTESVRRMSPEDLARYESVHLTPYLGEPEDIAAAVAFLASPEARFITGQVLSVDGGELAHMVASLRRS
jgi:NAD(P)-dependent dehydrogenase (short-subunit alcohol dehydrogenase family)